MKIKSIALFGEIDVAKNPQLIVSDKISLKTMYDDSNFCIMRINEQQI